MSTRGVLIVRDKKEKPQYYYIRSDADLYPEFQKGISGKTPNEYIEKVNKHVSTQVEGFNDKEARRFYLKRGLDPRLVQPMGDIEARNYVSNISATPDHVYVVDIGDKKRMKHYEPNPYCGSDEMYIPAYVKEDGTYVKGFCRKRK